MDKLYPIIRRKRRPLVVADVAPAVTAPVQSEPDGPPVVTKPLVESVPVEPALEKPASSHVENIPQNGSE